MLCLVSGCRTGCLIGGGHSRWPAFFLLHLVYSLVICFDSCLRLLRFIFVISSVSQEIFHSADFMFEARLVLIICLSFDDMALQFRR